jgi:signal transduction histidine kinase
LATPTGISSRQKWVFNLLVVYIIAALLWWGYLLLSKIADHHEAELANVELMEIEGSVEAVEAIKDRRITALQADYRRQRAMIFGEGVTFLTFILIGVFMTRRFFMKEVQLARQQKNFLLSITHELKSPLASSRLNLETVRLRNLDREKALELIGHAEQDINRLEALVQQLLLAARMEDMQQLIHRQQIDLYEVCDSVVQQWEHHPAYQREINTDLQHVEIAGDVDLLKVAVSNLLENALKYSPAGTAVMVRLRKVGQTAEIAVEDWGKPIPREEQSRIFDRFYRIGNEETRTSTGTGLGLYIVKKVAELHGGQVMVRAGESGGNVFVVSVPVG